MKGHFEFNALYIMVSGARWAKHMLRGCKTFNAIGYSIEMRKTLISNVLMTNSEN